MAGQANKHHYAEKTVLPFNRVQATLAFDGAVTSVKQISTARAAALSSSMNINTVRDLLSAYPLRYVDMSQVVTIQQAVIGNQYTISGHIHELKQKRPKPRLSLVEIAVVDETGLLVVTCFNQPWLADSLAVGLPVSVSGKVEFSYGFKRMTNPLVVIHEQGQETKGIVLPVHPSCAKISRTTMRRLVGNALEQTCGMYDPLPLVLRTKYRLYSRWQALRGMHNPASMEDATQARRRLRYEELFFLELDLIGKERARCAACKPYSHVITGPALTALSAALPFELSADQNQAVQEILQHMQQEHPMNHLLLGDVGTGKTVVAAHALAAAADTGMQAMVMGPTEVLVLQYGQALGSLLTEAGISWAILTGSTPAATREELLHQFSCGSLCVLMGTHALLEPEVIPFRCSLVCIDEQQRFGVEQREALVAKAPGCDILSMTATPIPRSLALALYGGLSLSYLHTPPAHQGGRSTTVCHFSEEGVAYDALRAALERGEQAYVICPLIGASLPSNEEQSNEPTTSSIEYAAIEWGIEQGNVSEEFGSQATLLHAAESHAEMLQNQVVPNARVGLLHGRMSGVEKNEIMASFRHGELDVLVSTTVVEVGVDVPNATVMIIEDADRFGLAQLHQLRGRVGRGSKPGQVFLVSRSKAPAALERLHIMERTEDGFALSEADLSLRREGDVQGLRQHGASPLRLVNVVRDAAVIQAAYSDACACYEPGFLTQDEWKALRHECAARQRE